MDIPKKVTTQEELDNNALKVMALHQQEMEFHAIARAPDSTSEERMEALEDGYLAELKMIKLAKTFTAEQYAGYQLERQCGCKYKELDIPEWEHYIS